MNDKLDTRESIVVYNVDNNDNLDGKYWLITTLLDKILHYAERVNKPIPRMDDIKSNALKIESLQKEKLL